MRLAPSSHGWLEVVCGPMFSGKSEELMRRMRRAEIARQQVCIVKPAIDDRYDAVAVVSHAGIRMEARPVSSASEVRELADECDVVGVDEAQFFNDDLVAVVQSLARGGRRVVCAASTRTTAGCRSDRCRTSSRSPSSSTSSRPSATGVAPRRR